MSILAALKDGQLSVKNSRLRKKLESMSWRQKFMKSLEYEYEFNDGKCLRISQIDNGEMKGLGTGTFVWPAAHVLAKYLEKIYKNGELCGKYVCDLGCGAGLTGFVAAALGAHVFLTDQAQLLDYIRGNCNFAADTASFNGGSVEVHEYNWGETPSFLQNPLDIVLISDCVLPKLYPISVLLQGLFNIMSPETLAYFSYEHRVYPNYDPREEFQKQCQSLGLYVEKVPMEDHDEKYSADDIEIWKVYFKNSSHQLIKKEPRYVWDYVRYLSSGLQDECRPFHRFELYDSFSKEYRETVILEELNQSRVGCTLWPSSVVASRLILKNYVVPDRIHRQLAVDVGCGCGLVTLSLLLSGYKVLALDHAEPLVFCKNNIEINDYLRDYRELVEFRAFDWNKQKLDLKDQSISTIVLSDCCYDVFAIDGLLNFLLDVCTNDTQVILVNEIRSALDVFMSSIAIDERCRFEFEDYFPNDDERYVGYINARPVRVVRGKIIHLPLLN